LASTECGQRIDQGIVSYKVIEFEQGKNAIELSSKSALEPTLHSIKKSVDNGEFDELLEKQLAYGSRLTKVNLAN